MNKGTKVLILLGIGIFVAPIVAMIGPSSSTTIIDFSSDSAQRVTERPQSTTATAPANSASDQTIQNAFDTRRSGLQVQGSAVVYRMLPDDLDGSRHQKFLLRLGNGLSLLIAHNIDLAPRIPNLEVGDRVEFYGVYEWNDKGGVVHWTHHDPAGRHVGGWLKSKGRTFQ